ncbi:MAG TPA: hypothetical protein VFU11_02065, partial [Solirubrobacterales bacterium]|nr:hypothetical protein [Solirubrobacterales bacterium]
AAPAATPAPGYSQFAGCPTATENPAVTACVRADITGGNFKMGSKNVPISKPMTMTGGLDPVSHNVYFGPGGGLTKVKQLVPGGVIGLTGLDWLVNFLSIESLQLFAVTEIAGTPQSTFDTLTMPVKVHLINPALGNNCYVGSTSNPIVLNLQTGTTSPPPPNTPITGTPPTIGFDPALEIISFTGGKFVDNSFAAPGASGCVLTLFGFIPISINGLVNSQSGLPAPAGTNETQQNINLYLAPEERVYP